MRSQGLDDRSVDELKLNLGNHKDQDDIELKKKPDDKNVTWRMGRRPMADLVSGESKKKYTENECFTRPNFAQLTPFKPVHNPWPTAGGNKGGNFPPPPTAAAAMRIMPPPRCFLGPFVIIDQLLNKFKTMKLPDKKEYVAAVKSGEFAKAVVVENGMEKKLNIKQLAPDTDKRQISVKHEAAGGTKRTAVKGETGSSVDIFKLRQAKRNKPSPFS